MIARHKSKSRRGHSLAEMAVALFVLSAIVAVGSDMLIHALRFTSQGERRQTALDECRDVMYRVSDELRNTVTVVDPSRRALLFQGSPYLVFTTPTATIGYRLAINSSLDPTQGSQYVVQRTVYRTGYTTGVPATQVALSSRNLTTAPSTLWFAIAGTGLPPGHGGTGTGPGTGLALGQQQDTIQVQLAVTPTGATAAWTMRTKKTLMAGVFPFN